MLSQWRAISYPLITFVVIIISWYAGIYAFDVPTYILPTPHAVLKALKYGYIDGAYYVHLAYTMRSVATGYIVGCGAAIVIGSLLAESPTFDRFVYPYIIALQSVPKVALAPLILVWFGFGIESNIVLVGLICFFPLLINTVIGIRHADPDLVDLMRAFSATRLQIFFHVRIPSAASHIFAGLQIGIVMALIGAVVAEFVSSRYGLGLMIESALVDMDTSIMFAGIFSLSALGIIGSQSIRWIHRKVVFWEREDARANTTMMPEG